VIYYKVHVHETILQGMQDDVDLWHDASRKMTKPACKVARIGLAGVCLAALLLVGSGFEYVAAIALSVSFVLLARGSL
jgi:hypothetical protein